MNESKFDLDPEKKRVAFGEDSDHPVITDDLKKWVEYAKKQKTMKFELGESLDLNPTIIIERDEKVLAIISSDDCDKEKGLAISALCQIGFDPDYITLLLDANLMSMEKTADKTPEQAEKEFKEIVGKKSLQKLVEEGKREEKGIVECVVCHRISRTGDITMASLAYSSENGKITWLEDKTSFVLDKNDKDTKLTGYLPESLREIMTQPRLEDKVPEFLKINQKMNYSVERGRFYIARVVMHILAQKGCLVKDFLSPAHLDWINYKEKAELLLKYLSESGVVPDEAIPYMQEVCNQFLGKKSFQDEMIELLEENSYWLPQEFQEDIDQFVYMFEKESMAPIVPSMGDFEKIKRVEVWNGDRSAFLGKGMLVGQVTVYFLRMDDGSIQSLENAEEEPEYVPYGASLEKSENNPKIVLDNGKVVYGCQVWFKEDVPKKEEKNE